MLPLLLALLLPFQQSVSGLSDEAGEPRGPALRVNFQSEGAPVPDGHVRDFGEAFGPRSGASQGRGRAYGWVVPGTSQALDRVGEGRDRDVLVDQRLDTLVHMEHPSGGVAGPGSWELALPMGAYRVRVVVGDPAHTNSTHVVRAEGVLLLAGFAPTQVGTHATVEGVVVVADGRLTIDSADGENTKLCAIGVAPAHPVRPAVASVAPTTLEPQVSVDGFVAATLHLPQASLESASVDGTSVQLYPSANPGAPVPAVVNTSGGGDVLVLDPIGPLAPFTQYTFEATSAVRDLLGNPLLDFRSSFVTGAGDPGGGDPPAVDFERLEVAAGARFTSVTFGPGGRLWALANDGLVHRFDVALDASLANETLFDALVVDEGGPRLAIGLVHDPASSPAEPVLWISHTTFGFSGMPDWGGAISRLSGPDLTLVERVVVGLPRSARDHVTNGLAFGPDGGLYFVQGSNSAMGAPDTAWADRPERLLSAAVLRLDPALALAAAPLDVQTEAGGAYDPFAPGAPLTLFASGVRNAYDLAWHSNGSLYVPTNGSAAGGNTPASPLPLPMSCDARLDGVYAGPGVPGLTGVNQSQADYLFRIVAGGYYGHPNPARCEWVMNGGNPTAAQDTAEVAAYPEGTLPDPNYRGFAYDFERNKSPNGIVEYAADGFGGALRGALLVTRYSGGDDLVVLRPDGPMGDVATAFEEIPAFDGLEDPLDVTSHAPSGNLYVSEYGASRLTLLRARDGDALGASAPAESVHSTVKGTVSDAQRLTLSETAGAALEVLSLALVGPDAAAFRQLAGGPSLPTTLPPGGTLDLDVEFAPPASTVGPTEAALELETERGLVRIGLFGLSMNGLEGGNEPPLAQCVETLGHALDVGGTALALGTTPDAIGDEVLEPLFRRAQPGAVTLTPVARYSPAFPLPFGYYLPNGPTPNRVEVGVLRDSASAPEHQTLFPALTAGGTSFDPGDGAFGLYTQSPSHEAYTEDALNALLFPSNVEHAARVYPLRDRFGRPVPDAFLVGFEEAQNGDYQDYVFVLRNVLVAGG